MKHQCYLGLCWLGIPTMIAKARTPRAAYCFLLTPCLAYAGLTWLSRNSFLISIRSISYSNSPTVKELSNGFNRLHTETHRGSFALQISYSSFSHLILVLLLRTFDIFTAFRQHRKD